jgi:magnesium-transporting ATPase (P-type)
METQGEESHNIKDTESLIDSVQSNMIEQGLSVDGNADLNDKEIIVFERYKELIEEYLKCASVCHECLVETNREGKRYFQSSSPDEVAICQRLKEIGVDFQRESKGIRYVKFFGRDLHFNMEMIFEFDSDRKRQSVVVKEGHHYKLYVKGADSAILPYLKKDIIHPY